jgi:magnesium-transporting ATPase (P-type)
MIDEMQIKSCFIYGQDEYNESSKESHSFSGSGSKSASICQHSNNSMKDEDEHNLKCMYVKAIKCMYFGCTARIEYLTESNPNGSIITKGNYTETAILKYLNNHHKEEFDKVRKERIGVLHWKQFNSARKRTTLVMQKLDNE